MWVVSAFILAASAPSSSSVVASLSYKAILRQGKRAVYHFRLPRVQYNITHLENMETETNQCIVFLIDIKILDQTVTNKVIKSANPILQENTYQSANVFNSYH